MPSESAEDFNASFGVVAPVVRVDEAASEKLARYRRVSLARDLYDLQMVRNLARARRVANPAALGARSIAMSSTGRGAQIPGMARTSAR
jgi:hypothetical protein